VSAGIDRKRVFDAARAGDTDTVRRALVDGFDPGSTYDDGRSIHQIGKTSGHRAIELLAREFQEQSTAAAEHGDPALILMLLEAGAELDFIAALSLRRFDLAEAMLRDDPTRIGPPGSDTIALHLSAEKKDETAVRWLIAHGVDVSAKRTLWDCHYTALHVTAANGAVEIARMLLDAGADPAIHDDKYDATVLGWADYCEQPEVAQLLRERGIAE